MVIFLYAAKSCTAFKIPLYEAMIVSCGKE